MSGGGVDAAAVEVDDASILMAREDHPPVEGVVALRVDEADPLQEIEGVALGRKMTPQIAAGGIADAEFLDQSGVEHCALFKVPQCLGVVRELPLIEGGSQFQHGGRLGWRSALLFEVLEALTEGEMPG